VSLIALAAALVATIGAAFAVRTTDARLATLATVLCLLVAPLVADPLPDPLVLAIRLVAAVVAGYLLLLPVRRAAPLLGTLRLGGTAEAGFVIGAFVVGLLAGTVASEAQGPAAALAAGFALLLAGLDLLAFVEDGVRLGTGAALALSGGALVFSAFAGTPGNAFQAALGLLLVAVAAATAWLALLAIGARGELRFGARHGDLRDMG
jgi:hypothetical protein